MDEEELRRMEALCDGATEGPWKAYVEGRDFGGGSTFIRTAGDDIEATGASDADLDFIASARQDVPRLIAEVRRLRAVRLSEE